MALTFKLLGVLPTNTSPITSMIQAISMIKLKVATISSQKKKLYLNPSMTTVLSKISVPNRTNEITRPLKKKLSEFLLVAQSLISSPTRAKRVTKDMTVVTRFPSTNSWMRFLILVSLCFEGLKLLIAFCRVVVVISMAPAWSETFLSPLPFDNG